MLCEVPDNLVEMLFIRNAGMPVDRHAKLLERQGVVEREAAQDREAPAGAHVGIRRIELGRKWAEGELKKIYAA